MYANMQRIEKNMKYQIHIVDGRSHFKSFQQAGARLGKIRRIINNTLRRFQRNASIALDLQHQLMQLLKLEKEIKIWDAFDD
jgi:hypothetical protein